MNRQLTENVIVSILSQCGFTKALSTYIGRNIPEKKARNAIESMKIPFGVQIYGLFDDTVFGSGKDGFCVCSNGVYFKVYLEQAGIIYYNDLPNMALSKGVKVGNYNIRFSSGTDIFYKLIEALQKYLTLEFIEINNGVFTVNINNLIQLFGNNDYVRALNEIQEIEKHFSEADLSKNMTFHQIKLYSLLELGELEKVNKAIKKFEATFKDKASEAFIKRIKEGYSSKMMVHNKETYQQLVSLIKKRLDKLTYYQIVLDEAVNSYKENDYSKVINNLDKITGKIEDAPDDMHLKYYRLYIESCIGLEYVNTAEKYFRSMKKNLPWYGDELFELDELIKQKNDELEERYLNEKRSEYTEQHRIAKMYEQYGQFESAYDTISIAADELPDKLQEEKLENIFYRTELLLSLYDYDSARKLIEEADLQTQYSTELFKKTDAHEGEHIEDNYHYKYNETNRLLKLGKIDKAEQMLNKALKLMDTFEARCTEINIFMLKLDYKHARKLLNELTKNEEIKNGVDLRLAQETILLLESEYKKMIDCIATLLKKEMAAGNIDYFHENEQNYPDFKDNDGNNLLLLSIVNYNFETVKALGNKESFNEVNQSGHGAAVLAAAKLDLLHFNGFVSYMLHDDSMNYINREYKENSHPIGTRDYCINEIHNEFSDLKFNSYGDAEAKFIKILYYKKCQLIYSNLQNFVCYAINEAMRDEYKKGLELKKKIEAEKYEEANLIINQKLEEINSKKRSEIAKLEQEFINYSVNLGVGEKDEFEKQEDYQQRRNSYQEANEERLRSQASTKWKDRFDKVMSKYHSESDRVNAEIEKHKKDLQKLDKQMREFEMAKEITSRYFSFSPNCIELDKYDADKECFEVSYLGVKGQLYIPINTAKNFKDEFGELSIEGLTKIEDTTTGFEIKYHVTFFFQGKEYVCTLQKEFKYIDLASMEEEIRTLKLEHNKKVEDELSELEADLDDSEDSHCEHIEEIEDVDESDEEETEDTVEANNESAETIGKGGLLNSPEMMELIDTIGQMTRAERVEYKNNLSSLGYEPLQIVKINLAINRVESKELTAMCSNIDTMPVEKLKRLKDKIERGNYNPAISEDFIENIEELVEELEG